MLHQLMLSGPTHLLNQPLNPPTLLWNHRPLTHLITSRVPRPHFLLNRTLLRRSRFKESLSSSDSDSDSPPPPDILPEKGELLDDQEANLSDQEQSLSEEQSYRETMRGIRSFMGWNHIPDTDSGATTSEDNPFAGPKLHTPGKTSVNLPTDKWLCRKMPN